MLGFFVGVTFLLWVKMDSSKKNKPICFISYSWDSEVHSVWINKQARLLTENGVEVEIDQWNLRPGSDLEKFMSDKIEKADFVIIFCTKNYKERSEKNLGGVGFESKLIEKGMKNLATENKFIPILANGSKAKSIPQFLSKKLYLDFRAASYANDFSKLLEHLGITMALSQPFEGSIRYTIHCLNDISHNSAKRYRAEILLEGVIDKTSIVNSIIEINSELKGRKYYRDNITKTRWGDSPADTISMFVYKNIQDINNTDWICRTQWMSPTLSEAGRMLPMAGEEIKDGTIVDWNQNYGQFSKLFKENELSKEVYLEQFHQMYETGNTYISEISTLFEQFDSGQISFESTEVELSDREDGIFKLYNDAIGLSGPFECRELNTRFHEFVSYLHNIVVPFSKMGKGNWEKKGKLYLSKSALKDVLRVNDFLKLELSKIR